MADYMKHKTGSDLSSIAKYVRRDILQMSYRARSAHSGGAYSCVEILVSLYFGVMRVFPKNALHESRDRLIFSKAHDAKALYAVLAERGFFDKKILKKYEVDEGILPGHSTRHCVPGVEVSAGALGHGLSLASGVALAGKMKSKSYRVFAVLSDGECDEGSTWEAALFAGHHGLSNLTVVVDYNKLQGYGKTQDILALEPFADKWRAFGWEAKEVDGHKFADLMKGFSSVPFKQGKPSVIIAHTIKGLGGPKQHVGAVSSQYKPPTEEEYYETLKSLGFKK